MPSSATKGTRKKQAAKKAAKQGEPAAMPAQRGQKKGKKGKKDEPKKKQYIPPVKPARAVIDPVDLYGLGVAGDSAVSADVVVSLRKLAKKDEKTIARALDELQQWIETMKIGGGNIAEAMSALPVWVHLNITCSVA